MEQEMNNQQEEPMIIDGKEVSDIRIQCSKHGDISQGSVYLRYTTVSNGEKQTIVNNNNLLCMCCLNELYTKFQNEPETEVEISYQKNPDGSLMLDENNNPIRIKKEKIIYERNNDGTLKLDDSGNPIPKKIVGNVSVDVQYKNPEKPQDGEE